MRDEDTKERQIKEREKSDGQQAPRNDRKITRGMGREKSGKLERKKNSERGHYTAVTPLRCSSE